MTKSHQAADPTPVIVALPTSMDFSLISLPVSLTVATMPMADWATLVESIRGLVDRFPPETIVYSGHGPETTLGAELARNPFLAELRA